MKVKDLIERLQKLPPEAEVLAWDADCFGWEEVTGYVYDPTYSTVYLYTDCIE